MGQGKHDEKQQEIKRREDEQKQEKVNIREAAKTYAKNLRQVPIDFDEPSPNGSEQSPKLSMDSLILSPVADPDKPKKKLKKKKTDSPLRAS